MLGSDLDARRLRRLLPPAWPVLLASEPEAVLPQLEETSVLSVCSWTGDPGTGVWREIAYRCGETSIPMVALPRPKARLSLGTSERWDLLCPHLALGPETASPRVLSRWVLEQSTERVFSALWAFGTGRWPRGPLLRSAYRLIVSQARGGTPAAGLAQVASHLGCHRSSLWRAGTSEGVDLSVVIRRVRVVNAVARYSGNWDEVAAELELTPSAVGHLFRRTLHCTPGQASAKTFREYALWVAEAIIERPASRAQADLSK